MRDYFDNFLIVLKTNLVLVFKIPKSEAALNVFFI